MNQEFIMEVKIFILFLGFFISFSSSSNTNILNQGSSLSSPQDVLVSSTSGIFTAGFYPIGINAYVFAIWYSMPFSNEKHTLVWIANRDQPVNGKYTKFSLLKSGNLVLTDGGQFTVWTSNTNSRSPLHLQLHDSGNLILTATLRQKTLWQSFDSPTNTLLPQQLLTENGNLLSYRSQTNYSSGFYKLFFDNDNVLRLVYRGLEISSVFWPPPFLLSWEVGRSTYNTTKVATLDRLGNFTSSDNFNFLTADYGMGPQRRLTLDPDGNLRVYSLNQKHGNWDVTWQADVQPCRVHGVCGANSLCTYVHNLSGRRCACLPGHKMKNDTDWSYGCEQNFELSCSDNNSIGFFQLHDAEFYGYDIGVYYNVTIESCKNICVRNCDCKGFQYKYETQSGTYNCFPKTLLFNGYQSPSFNYPAYMKVSKSSLTTYKNHVKEFELNCRDRVTPIDVVYKKEHEWIKYLFWCAGAVGVTEIIILLICFFATRLPTNATSQGYLQVGVGFKRFTYAELKKATRGFNEEIGRGSSGVVYKGTLSDNRIAAIKCLSEARQGEAEFLAEIGISGRLNHMNLMETWGYCSEGKHRLLVYEYLELGSLSNFLYANKLNFQKRFEIAVGTAKGLAYLHEECLEWVLHCDVKPQNILLDSNFRPKVADFGLSKLNNRNRNERSTFSRIRGTRGYMAPEWVYNLPITSKVDVYSYGIVLLELITGRNLANDNEGGLVNWVRGKVQDSERRVSWIEEIVDTSKNGEIEKDRAETMVKVALQCAEEDRDSRPKMSQVVDMLLSEQGE
ncbi:putative receptor protein kinase ZmPK1 [Olea europaea var. sylvestris]|uniref:putative receptor protein kinase ZmPK1 n=1 Tax=Olea europaea var. sylvestris TaxID=158386 RepID=UPI000C1CF75A|nr:putative receptor protein kinase ZmPK1 [Olea europaea var. sylvestris]